MSNPPQIFISYAREDYCVVRKLYDRLKAAGYKPWMDKVDLLAGAAFDKAIPKVLRESDLFIVCLSPNSVNKRSFIQHEINLALDIFKEKLGDDLPVESVSWHDVQVFCEKLRAMIGKAFRLPSEAEWEYSCRAGTTGDYAGNLGEMAWYNKNSGDKMHSVGQKKPNALGLYDMHGNVWEWCEDVRHDDYNGAPKDGSAWTDGGNQDRRMLRGGSWGAGGNICRSTDRNVGKPGSTFYEFGLRVVVSSRTP